MIYENPSEFRESYDKIQRANKKIREASSKAENIKSKLNSSEVGTMEIYNHTVWNQNEHNGPA